MAIRPEILVLAGGVGERLRSVTGSNIPKCEVPIRENLKGIDILLKQFEDLKVDVTFSADHYFYRYKTYKH